MYLMILLFSVFFEIVISATPFQKNCTKTCASVNTAEFYRNKIILAPMVRMNTLPFRLLALDYGADIVYSEEIVDHSILHCERYYNEFFDTVDYIDTKDGTLVFRTSPREKDKLIFQLGTSDPERAAKAAKLVGRFNDVAGIDINMGCPVHFSVVGGMGAELLSDPPRARQIIEYVRKAVDLPITCKIRVHEDVEETISFCKQMVDGGVTAIAVHGRTRKERSARHRNRLDAIKNVSSSLSIPVIANGESNNIGTHDDILSIKENSGCASVMIARAAQYNPSIFRKEGKLPINDVIKAYLKYAIYYDNCYPNTKYCVQSMLQNLMGKPEGKALVEAHSVEKICKIWDMDTYWRQRLTEFNTSSFRVKGHPVSEREKKKFEIDTILSNCPSLQYKFQRDNFERCDSPKNVLQKYSVQCRVASPKYNIWNVDNNLFRAVVTFAGKNYTSTYWERNKKSAELGASVVCLFFLKVYTEYELRPRGGAN